MDPDLFPVSLAAMFAAIVTEVADEFLLLVVTGVAGYLLRPEGDANFRTVL